MSLEPPTRSRGEAVIDPREVVSVGNPGSLLVLQILIPPPALTLICPRRGNRGTPRRRPSSALASPTRNSSLIGCATKPLWAEAPPSDESRLEPPPSILRALLTIDSALALLQLLPPSETAWDLKLTYRSNYKANHRNKSHTMKRMNKLLRSIFPHRAIRHYNLKKSKNHYAML